MFYAVKAETLTRDDKHHGDATLRTEFIESKDGYGYDIKNTIEAIADYAYECAKTEADFFTINNAPQEIKLIPKDEFMAFMYRGGKESIILGHSTSASFDKWDVEISYSKMHGEYQRMLTIAYSDGTCTEISFITLVIENKNVCYLPVEVFTNPFVGTPAMHRFYRRPFTSLSEAQEYMRVRPDEEFGKSSSMEYDCSMVHDSDLESYNELWVCDITQLSGDYWFQQNLKYIDILRGENESLLHKALNYSLFTPDVTSHLAKIMAA